MSKMILSNATITVDGVDLTDHIRSVTVNQPDQAQLVDDLEKDVRRLRAQVAANDRHLKSYTQLLARATPPGKPMKQRARRSISQPLWMKDDEVVIHGTEQVWKIRSAEWRCNVGEPQEMTLELISTGERQRSDREDALAAAPDDVRECLQALYDLEDALPADKEAIVDVEGNDATRFTVRVVDRDSQ